MALTSGTKLGPYEIQSPLGAGGMGEVYRARDSRLNRVVAIKVLPATFSSDADRLSRFQQEAYVLSALNHPSLLAIFDVGSQDGVHYLVSEYLEGQTLRELMNLGGLPLRKVTEYSLQLANGLSAAHEKGIIHRDLKPENIFVTRDERVKILDFGLAKQAQAGTGAESATMTGPNPTAQGMVLGTVGYMSPEQVRGQLADNRSDIFSFGVILYELLSGKRAFKGDSNVETMNAILKDDPPELPEDEAHAAPGLQRIMRRCLEKSPERRLQSASDLAFAIEALSGYSGMAAPVNASPTHRRSWLLPGAIAAFVMVLASAGLYAWHERSSPPPSVTFNRLSFLTQAVFNARFAPDGETVVYSAALEGNRPELFIHRREAQEAQKLDLEDVELLSVSSKGELALLTNARFIRHRWFRGTLARMDLGASAPREMLENVTDADWTPDGSKLAILHQVGAQQNLEYPIGTVLYKTNGLLSDIRFSPDGKKIAFMEHPAGVDDRGTVNVIDLQGSKRVLTRDFEGEEGLAWSPNGDEIYFSGASDEALPRLIIQAVNLSGRARNVLEVVDYLWVYDVSPKGQFLVVDVEERQEVMGRAPGVTAERNLSWLDQSGYAAMSSDGRHVLFVENSIAPNYAVAYRSSEGSPVVRLGDGVACDLSKDGRWALAFVPSSPMQLMLYPTGAGQPKQLERGSINDYTSAQLFRDNRRVLSCGREIGHGDRCYVQDITGGSPSPVTPEGTLGGMPSPDGKSVVARATDGTFSIYSLEGAPTRPLTQVGPQESVVGWTANGRALLVSQYRKIPAPVEQLDLESGRRTRVIELAPADRAGVLVITNASFSDDMKSYAYSLVRLPSRLAIVTGAR
jgi:serine/threonine protein kinase/Tol biopolymer transport system component